MFNQEGENYFNQKDQFIKLNIYTQNQGLAITPASDYTTKNNKDDDSGAKITYSNDVPIVSSLIDDSTTSSQTKLLLESMIEG